MLDDETDEVTRAQLLRLAPSGDLLDLARGMREMGVESLLFCSPGGRIQQVITDRQIAHLAGGPAADRTVDPQTHGLPDRPQVPPQSVEAGQAIPRQEAPAGAEPSVPAARP